MPEEKKNSYKGQTDARRRASAKYLKESVEDIRIRVPKGQKEIIKAAAAAAGESVNGYIKKAIDDRMEREAENDEQVLPKWKHFYSMPLFFFVGNCDGIAGIETLLDGEQVGHRSIFAPLPLGNELLLSFGQRNTVLFLFFFYHGGVDSIYIPVMLSCSTHNRTRKYTCNNSTLICRWVGSPYKRGTFHTCNLYISLFCPATNTPKKEVTTMKQIKQFDTVLLKDGREAAVVEAFENKAFLVDVGDSPKDWDTISITIDDIEKVISEAEPDEPNR